MLLSRLLAAARSGDLFKISLGAIRKVLQTLKFKTFRRFDLKGIPDMSSFYSWHKRPIKSSHVFLFPTSVDHSDTGVVIQGQVEGEVEFIKETIKLYQRQFMGSKIVVSTWDSTKESTISQLHDLGVEVVISEIPDTVGFGNVNLQLKSSIAGLEFASSFGLKYLLKTRSDQRLYSPTAISQLKHYVEQYPVFETTSVQSARLVTLSSSYTVYGLSDFLTFGYSADVVSYWQSEFVSGSIASFELRSDDSASEIKTITPEVYLCASFLERTGWKSLWTEEDWLEAIRNRFLIIDPSSLDFFWNKYSSKEYWDRRYVQSKAPRIMSFGEWVEIFGQNRN